MSLVFISIYACFFLQLNIQNNNQNFFFFFFRSICFFFVSIQCFSIRFAFLLHDSEDLNCNFSIDCIFQIFNSKNRKTKPLFILFSFDFFKHFFFFPLFFRPKLQNQGHEYHLFNFILLNEMPRIILSRFSFFLFFSFILFMPSFFLFFCFVLFVLLFLKKNLLFFFFCKLGFMTQFQPRTFHLFLIPVPVQGKFFLSFLFFSLPNLIFLFFINYH